MEQTDTINPIDQAAIDKAIVKLCEEYPGKFDVLPYMTFKEDLDYWGPISYCRRDKVAIYNPMHLDVFVLPAALAFISLLVSSPYVAVHEKLETERERYFYNCAVHVYILRQMRQIGDFALPAGAMIDFNLEDRGQSVDELYDELQATTVYDPEIEPEELEYGDE